MEPFNFNLAENPVPQFIIAMIKPIKIAENATHRNAVCMSCHVERKTR